MKNFFKKIKSYGFWVSLSSAIILLVTALGNAFGFEIENKIIEDVVMSVAGVLVVFGIVSMNKNVDETGGEGQEIVEDDSAVEIDKDEKVEKEEDLEKKSKNDYK